MREFIRYAAGALACLVISGATVNAASLNERTVYNAPSTSSLKDGPVAVDPVLPAITWNGFYVGAHVGYMNANHEINVDERYDIDDGGGSENFNWLNLNGLNSSGAVGGVNGGYDWSNGSVLIGALAGYTWDAAETSLSAFGRFNATLKKENEWYVGARAGLIPWKHTAIYIGGAYIETEYELSSGGFKQSEDYQGFKALAGIETHISGGAFLKLEYQHNFLGDVTWLNEDGFKVTDTADEDIALIGVVYKIGAPQF